MTTTTEPTEEVSITATTSRLRVLLVDDIPENLSLLEEVLGDQGYDTVSVSSGAEALRRLSTDHFTLSWQTR